jgi:hypothetical protein
MTNQMIKECAAKKTISNTPDPTIQKVTPIAKTEDNSLTTFSTQADNKDCSNSKKNQVVVTTD